MTGMHFLFWFGLNFYLKNWSINLQARHHMTICVLTFTCFFGCSFVCQWECWFFCFPVRAFVICCSLSRIERLSCSLFLGKLEKQPEHRRQNICDHDISMSSRFTLTMWQDWLQDFLPPSCFARIPCSVPWLFMEFILMEVTQSRIYNGSFGPKWMTPYTKQMSIYYIFPAGIHSPAWLNIRYLKAAKFRISDQNKHLAAVQSTSFWLWFFSILLPHPHCSYPFPFLGDSPSDNPFIFPFYFFFYWSLAPDRDRFSLFRPPLIHLGWFYQERNYTTRFPSSYPSGSYWKIATNSSSFLFLNRNIWQYLELTLPDMKNQTFFLFFFEIRIISASFPGAVHLTVSRIFAENYLKGR